MAQPVTNDKKFRWLELGVTMLVSAASSGLAVSWTLSATLQELKTRSVQQDQRLGSVEAQLVNVQTINSIQSTQIAVTDANYQNILRELAEIITRLKR